MRGIDNFNFPILNGRYLNEHRGQIHLGLQHLLRVGIWPDSENRTDGLFADCGSKAYFSES